MSIMYVDFDRFHSETIDFLVSIAPGEPNSPTRLSKNPFPFPKVWWKFWGKWDKGRIWSVCKYSALWYSKDIFKDTIEKYWTNEDGSPKKFTNIGTNKISREDKHIAIGVNDYTNARILVFTNSLEQIYFEDTPLCRVLCYDEKIKAWPVLAATAAIPLIFSSVDIFEDGGACGDGALVNYLPSSYLKEEAQTVQMAISCSDLDLPRLNPYEGKGKYKWEGVTNLIESLAYSFLIAAAHKDMEAFYEAGNSYYYQFEYSEIHPKMNPISFDLLNKKLIEKAYNIGLKRGRQAVKNMTEKDKEQAKGYGITLALSGGGTLFPAMYGMIAGIAEEAYKLKDPVAKRNTPARVKAMIGGSGGALAAAYMVEHLPV